MAVQKPIWITLFMLPIDSLIHCSHPKLNSHGVQAEWCTSWCPWTCPWCRWMFRVHWQLPSTCVVTPDIFCFIDFVLKERFPEVPFAVTRKNWRHPTLSIHPKNNWRHPTFYSANSQIIVLKAICTVKSTVSPILQCPIYSANRLCPNGRPLLSPLR